MRFISCLRWQGYFSDEPCRIFFRSQSFSIFIEAIWPQLLHFQDYSCRACLFIWVTIKEPERAAVIRNWLIGTRCIWRPAWLTEVSVKTYGLCWYNVCVYSLKKKKKNLSICTVYNLLCSYVIHNFLSNSVFCAQTLAMWIACNQFACLVMHRHPTKLCVCLKSHLFAPPAICVYCNGTSYSLPASIVHVCVDACTHLHSSIVCF